VIDIVTAEATNDESACMVSYLPSRR